MGVPFFRCLRGNALFDTAADGKEGFESAFGEMNFAYESNEGAFGIYERTPPDRRRSFQNKGINALIPIFSTHSNKEQGRYRGGHQFRGHNGNPDSVDVPDQREDQYGRDLEH